MGKVIVIEGSDGSGKATQTKLLYEYLKGEGKQVRMVTYPNYESQSSSLVKMYLGKEFGDDVFAVNAYVTSAFYAVDRFASYIKEWKEYYQADENNIIICDRYVTSNMLHQTAKIEDKKEKMAFLDWEYDFEFVKGGLPVPDYVFFLDVKPETTFRLMKNRKNKFTNQDEKDIHESNQDFLIKSYENSLLLGNKYGWNRIPCCDDEGNMKPIKDIHEMILERSIGLLRSDNYACQKGHEL